MSTPTSQGNALALSQQGTTLSLQVSSVDDLQRLARLFAASGLFGRGNPDALIAECAVRLVAGMEVSMTPFQAVTSIYIVNGRPGFSAQALAQAIKKHPRYDYRVVSKSDQACRIAFYESGEKLGEEEFTMAMAERAGLVGKAGPWRQYPEAMLFARALTAGMRTHCPDALGGHTPYTPEELGAQGQIDEQGMVTVTEVTERPMLTSTEDLVAGAQRACDARGLTAGGLTVFLDELGATCLQELERHQLARLAKSGLSPETVARCNAAAEALVSPADDADDLPATWTEPATAAAA